MDNTAVRLRIVNAYKDLINVMIQNMSECEMQIIEQSDEEKEYYKEKYAKETRAILAEFIPNYYSTENFDKWNEFRSILEDRVAQNQAGLAAKSFISYMALYGKTTLTMNCNKLNCANRDTKSCADCIKNVEPTYIPPDRYQRRKGK